MYAYIYIYIHIERERERDGERMKRPIYLAIYMSEGTRFEGVFRSGQKEGRCLGPACCVTSEFRDVVF